MNRFSWKQWVHRLRRNPSLRRRPVPRISRTVETIEDRTLLSFQLVGDINAVSRDSTPQDFVQIGSLTYFTADDGIHGRELWKTDGTAAGTMLVKDIHPADSLYSGSYPSHLTAVGEVLYFVADNGANGRELWKSDGSAAGTQLVADVQAGGAFSGSAPSGLVSFSGSLYFTADDGVNGRELWKSSGTAGTTQRITNLNTGGDSFLEATQLVNFNGQLVFAARQGSAGSALWVSNGTTGGTTLLKDLIPDGDGILHFDSDHVASTSTTLYFVGNTASTGGELWKTDGTTLGTVPVKDILPGVTSSDPQSFTLVGDTLYFLATEVTSGQELWKSDGTLNGTVIVKDIRVGNTGSGASNLVGFQGELFFAADDGTNGTELWMSDGSTAGTVLVKNINPSATGSAPQGLLAVGSTLYFSADNGSQGRELWKSDGSSAGTQLVRDIQPGLAGSSESFNPSVLGSLGNSLLFSADDGQHGLDLWTSNGSTSGTVLVKDVNSITQGAYPSFLTSLSGGIVFAADDGQSGTEIWFSTGVANSVLRLVDANTGMDGSDPADFTLVNDTVYFTALNGSLGRELWKTDGTQQGTAIVKDISPGVASSDPADLVNVNGELFFSAADDVFGRELWKSDGSLLGTVRVADISAGGVGSSPDELIAVGSTLYFRALGDQLWKSDGSAAGTQLVADINSTGDSQLAQLTNFGGTLFFVAEDGVDGQELWQTNGLAEGTQQVLDILDGPSGSQPLELTVANGQLYFTADNGTQGRELWVSDGTPGGTHLVEDILLGPTSSLPSQLTAVNGQLFFVATDDSHGAELWVSNGTDAGTNMVADLLVGSASSNPGNLAAVNGLLYFVANDGVIGLEPWQSNGTPGGTQPVADLNPGSAGSLPRNFTSLGSFLLFAADDGLHGVELMSDVTNRAPVLSNTEFAVPDGATSGTLIGTLMATDQDVGQTLTYSIESGNTSDAFLLNPSTGQLTVNNSEPLDPEVNPQFTLTVKVTDNGTPAGFTVATVIVHLAPVNQAPTIANQVFSLPENSANNTVVGTVLANDEDLGQVLTYAITAGNATGAFSINAATGQITVANSSVLDFESTTSFALTVQVTDNGIVPQSAAATMTVNLTNIDEPPQITLPAGSLTYTRGNPPVFPGMGATISDPDTLTLNFQGGNVTVSISQGQIKTDKLTVDNGGGVTRKGKNVLSNGTIVGKLSGGKKGQPLTVTFNSSVTTAAVQQILRQIGYSNTSKKTPPGTRTIQFRVTDSGNHTSPSATKQITLT